MQCQMFIAINTGSTPINFKKIIFDKFLCPHILHDIAALHYITVFLYHSAVTLVYVVT